jgi:hypothetical protein
LNLFEYNKIQMSSSNKPTTTMVPISGRIPDDLYQWLATVQLEGATTVSDKMRVAVATLKRLHDGDSDYMGALSMYRDLGRSTRERIAALEPEHGHSEVLAAVAEHAPALAAGMISAQIHSLADAKALEDQLVRRSMQLAETLLRQALTSHASAYDDQVVRKNTARVVELAQVISSTQEKGGLNG